MTHPGIARLGLAVDDDPLFADLIDAVRAAARDLGVEPVDVRTPADERGVDLTLVVGRPARHVPLLATASDVPRVVWSGEPLAIGPTGAGPTGRHRPVAPAPAAIPRRDVGRAGRWLRRAPLAGPPARWRASVLARRLVRTNLAELAWAVSVGAGLVVTSHDRADVLAAHGLAARVVPFGYHRVLAGPLTAPEVGDRPSPIVTLGAPSPHLRRGHVLARMGAEAAAAGPTVTALRGVWGEARGQRLRDARVLVDVHRVPGTFVGIRLVLALAAGVAVVTEPMPDPRPFEAGVTHLEAPADRLLATARALVADEARRRAIVDAGQALLADRLRLTDSLRAILAPSMPSSPPPGDGAGTSARRR